MARIDELKDPVITLTERVSTLRNELTAVIAKQDETVRSVTEMRREYEKDIALLKRELADIQKWKDEQKKERDEVSRRLWAFGPNLVGAIVSGLIAFVVAYFTVNR